MQLKVIVTNRIEVQNVIAKSSCYIGCTCYHNGDVRWRHSVETVVGRHYPRVCSLTYQTQIWRHRYFSVLKWEIRDKVSKYTIRRNKFLLKNVDVQGFKIFRREHKVDTKCYKHKLFIIYTTVHLSIHAL